MAEPPPRASDLSRSPLLEGPGAAGAPTIFVSDPTAEAERASQALRAVGYAVVDVPLSLLVARVAVQRPAVVVLDVDAEGAREVVARMREVPGSEAVDVLFVGEMGRQMHDSTDAALAGASGFFPRPLDVSGMVRKIRALAPVDVATPSSEAPMSEAPGDRTGVGDHPSTIPPGSLRVPTLEQPRSSSRPPRWPSPRPSGPPSMAPASLLDAQLDLSTWGMAAGPPGVGTQLSDELQRVLATAEERVGSSSPISSQPPSPEDEVDAVLPADLLAVLDEPLDFDDDEDGSGAGGAWQTGTPGRGRTTGVAPFREEPPSAAREEEARTSPPGPLSRFEMDRLGPGRDRPPPSPARALTRDGRDGRDGRETGDAGLAAFEPDEQARVTPRPPWGRPGRDEASDLAPTRSLEGDPLEPQPESEPPPPTRGPRRGVTSASEPAPAPSSLPPLSPQPTSPARGRPDRFLAEPATSARFGPEPGTSPRGAPVSSVLPPPPRPAEPPKAAEPPRSVALSSGEGVKALATAIAERYTGSLCFDGGGGLRRVVLRDGDLVTASSSFDAETLVAYLVERGELPRDLARKLVGRAPPFGRHAGAALVAHGHVGQDRLWEVLRGHAEWVVGRAVGLEAGACVYEGEPPGRLRAEPSVFGGSTGAEVLVEVVSRVVSPAEAIEKLGGRKARLGDGRRRPLLAECALSAREVELVERSRGFTVEETLEAAKSTDFAPVLWALRALGVLETLAPSEAASRPPPPPRDALDDEALRARVRARLDLVEEGDYFAVLGVARSATPYEIKRAYLELRRSFEPSRVLTAATADLGPQLQLILEVLDEAHEVLRDATRRERYRRAIEAGPPS